MEIVWQRQQKETPLLIQRRAVGNFCVAWARNEKSPENHGRFRACGQSQIAQVAW